MYNARETEGVGRTRALGCSMHATVLWQQDLYGLPQKPRIWERRRQENRKEGRLMLEVKWTWSPACRGWAAGEFCDKGSFQFVFWSVFHSVGFTRPFHHQDIFLLSIVLVRNPRHWLLALPDGVAFYHLSVHVTFSLLEMCRTMGPRDSKFLFCLFSLISSSPFLFLNHLPISSAFRLKNHSDLCFCFLFIVIVYTHKGGLLSLTFSCHSTQLCTGQF